jgi:hypothetical protein
MPGKSPITRYLLMTGNIFPMRNPMLGESIGYMYIDICIYIYIHNIQYLIGESKSIVFVNQDVHCIYYSPIFLLEYQSLGMLNVGMLPTHVGILKIGNVCPISDYSIIKMDALFASWRMFQSYTSILRCSGHPTH